MGFNLKKILRALLFSTSDPLTIKDIQAVVTRYHSELENAKKALAKNAEQNDSIIQMPPDPQLDEPRGENSVEQTEIEDIMSQVPTLLTATQIREAMEEIAGELEENGDVCRLLQSSSGFKLAISKDYADWVRLLRNDPRPQKLTRAALETLAIIAYRQPVTRAEIEAIRGVNADSAITRLTEKELIFISGRADLPGRPVQFSTTSNFLDFIGSIKYDKPSVLHNSNSVRKSLCLFHIVRGKNYSNPTLERANNVPKLASCNNVKTERWLVKKQNLRLAD